MKLRVTHAVYDDFECGEPQFTICVAASLGVDLDTNELSMLALALKLRLSRP